MQTKLSCPHCKKSAISIIRKMIMGPAVAGTCRSCGKKVGISYAPMSIGAAPFIASVIFVRYIDPVALKVGLIIAGFFAMSFIHLYIVPLEKR